VTNLPKSSGKTEIWDALGRLVLGTLVFVPTALSAIVLLEAVRGAGDKLVYGV
jgi:hypothetical protein